jgi:hypothetical protein
LTAILTIVPVQQSVAATDGTYADVYWINSCSGYGNTAPVFQAVTGGTNWTNPDECGPGSVRDLEINATGNVYQGHASKWTAMTPTPALRIVGVATSSPSPNGALNNPAVECHLSADGFVGDYYWGDEGTNYGTQPITVDCHGGTGEQGYPEAPIDRKITPSRYFGWQIECSTKSTCTPTGGLPDGGVFGVEAISLEVQETTGPSLSATGDNLWNQQGWVRGAWSADLGASDPSGVCAMAATVDGAAIASYIDPARDVSQWAQCHGSSLNSSVDTTSLPSGANALTLGFAATNAAGAASSVSRTISVDNEPVALSLTGPSDVPSSGAAASISASASAGPSGVHGISCSTDGGSASFYPGATAQIPVSGLGTHHVSCTAQNNALDSAGQRASSSAQTFTITLRSPTNINASFGRLVGEEICRGHGTARRCRPRTIKRREVVTKIIRRHGKKVRIKRVRVVRRPVVPHLVTKRTLRVRYGHAATVQGVLGSQGAGLAGRAVTILAAPADGASQFAPIAHVTTDQEGAWRAKVPPGPSRLITASFGGTDTEEPAVSAPITLSVPAALSLRVSPPHTHWGGQVTITGRLKGGYIPPRGELVVLRISYKGGVAEIGHVYTTAEGRFSLPYHFLNGAGHASYRIWAVTAAESGYPFASGRSRSVRISVGP